MIARRLLAAGTGALALALTAAPAQAAPVQTLDPAGLSRGADPAIPHVEGRTIVDGSVRVPVAAGRVDLLGKAGTAYVVGAERRNGADGRLLRVEATGAVTELGPGYASNAVLSQDGLTIASTRTVGGRATVLKVRSAVTGATVAKRRFAGYVRPIALRGSAVTFSSYRPMRTATWDTTTGSVSRLTRRIGSLADVAHDLLVSYTDDVYSGGCSVVSRLSNPRVQLWRTCDYAVYALSTDGSHVVAVDILTDGIGPSLVSLRTVTGSEVGRYRTRRGGYFGALQFEDADTLLLGTTSGGRTATVRCTAATCDLASDVRKAEPYRAG